MSILKSGTKASLETALASVNAKNDLVKALGVTGATFTVGAEAANVITVNVQLKDELGEVSGVRAVTLLVLSAAAGTAFNTTDYTSIAAGTDGALVELVADKVLLATCEADGDLDVVFTLSSGGATSYLAVVLADGSLAVSGAITHAA